jgi:Phage portal protein
VIVERLRGKRSLWPSLSVNEYLDLINQFAYQGVQYTLPGDKQEDIDTGLFRELVRSGYKQNGIIFACMLVRMMVFSEARPQYRSMNSGRPGKLFGNTNLQRFENPWPGATSSDLLKRMIQYADIAGNAYVVRQNHQDGSPGCRVLRPDWTSAIIGSMEDPSVAAWDVNAEVIGYNYQPGGKAGNRPPEYFLANEVAHFAPIPDPEAQFRGMSWITPIIQELMADKAATGHKLKFFENGATPNLVVKMSVDDLTKFKEWIEAFREEYEGQMQAYKTMFLGAGSDPVVVGANLRQLDFKVVQGAGETRIAAAAGTPPIIVGLSEGLASATYSNYAQARRRFAGMTMRPLWRDAFGSLETIADMPTPGTNETVGLWYDDKDIPALQEDQTDAAEVSNTKATALMSLFSAGFEMESAVQAVETGDFTLLEHTGLTTVQAQPGAAPPATNGRVAMPGAGARRRRDQDE